MPDAPFHLCKWDKREMEVGILWGLCRSRDLIGDYLLSLIAVRLQ